VHEYERVHEHGHEYGHGLISAKHLSAYLSIKGGWGGTEQTSSSEPAM
jgi:hypothetical protein